MTNESKPGEGVLFFNDKKQGKQPDRRGTLTIEGVEYEIAGWNRESKGGKLFTSLTAKRKQATA